jgi:sigma-B regulation protein RsbU (phosphoserine phosphatase)
VSGTVVRRVRLPADRRSPAAARALVRSVLSEADLTDLLDEALLLTTELSTNGVLHAGTDIDLEIVVDDGELTVVVTDSSTVSPAVAISPAVPASHLHGADVPERGRGLFLVDHFAAAWGVTHHASGKEVWFRLGGKPDELDRPVPGPRFAPGPAAPPEPDDEDLPASGPGTRGLSIPGTPGLSRPAAPGPVTLGLASPTASDPSSPVELGAPSPAALAALAAVELRADENGSRGPDSPIGKLLSRLCDAAGATCGAVLVDLGNGGGQRVLAEYDPPAPAVARADAAEHGGADGAGAGGGGGGVEIRVPLSVSRPWRGELMLITPAATNGYARPLAELTAERLSLALENDRLRRADVRRQAWLTFLAEASELLAQSLEVDLTMALIPRLIVPRLGRWCAVYSIDEWNEPQLAAATHGDEAALPTLLTELAAPVPLARIREAVRTGAQVPLPPGLIGFALPLVARGQRLGALVVGRLSDHRQDLQEVTVIEDVTRRAALAVDNARIHTERRRVADTLQQSLLPPALPTVDGIAFGAEYVPTLGDADVGGDFYDVVPMPDGRWLVVVGDVSGKGVQAAAITGLVRDVIRVLVRDGRSLPEMLRRINETLVERGGGRYCTLAMAAVGVAGGDRLDISLHLAGHDRPVLVRTDGEARFVGVPGTALGLLQEVATPAVAVPLNPGDTLVFYTDGVTERRRGMELFGLDRLREAVGPLAGYAADVMAARLRATTLGFSPEPPRDDIAILALRNDFAH